ncbi:MAG: T9SS type A sorting domain-containing protein, partial [Calditrichaeota bacterium]|nr:T9SS type A sorting domain-containing protein [Calditrichota bacterium]
NDAPVIDLPPTIAFDEDTIWQQDFSAWISDVDSGSLGLSASGANELAVTVAGLDVSIVPPANWNGSECIVFFVDDFEGRAIASDTLCVTVLPVNDDPTVAMSLDTLTIQEGGFDESIDLNQIFTDLDGDLLAFSVSGNVNLAVEISGSGLVRIESTSAFTGEELLVFTAEDGQGRTASWKSGILQPSRQKARGKGATVADDSRASVSEDLLVIVTPQSASGGVDLPVAFALEQNYPNPFNPTTLIRLAMPETGPARVTVHDMTGRLVAVLHDGILSRGSHEIIFDGAGLPSGIYIYRAEAVGQSQTRKMMLVK